MSSYIRVRICVSPESFSLGGLFFLGEGYSISFIELGCIKLSIKIWNLYEKSSEKYTRKFLNIMTLKFIVCIDLQYKTELKYYKDYVRRFECNKYYSTPTCDYIGHTIELRNMIHNLRSSKHQCGSVNQTVGKLC